jgi:glycosyltransferase involved in cell wall biosynthesis
MGKENKKIALVFSSLEIGGVQRLMLHLMKGMLALGLRVDVVLVNAHGQFLEQLPEGVNLVKLNAGRAFNSIVPLVHYFRMAYPDVVLSALTHINLSVIIAQKLSGFCVRLVVSEHNNLSERTSHAKKLFDKLAHIVARLFYPFSDSIVCVSKDSATDLIKRTGLAENKVTVVYNPVPVDEVRQLSEEDIGHPWFKPNQPPVILAVGRLSKQKDYPVLLKAFELLHTRQPSRLIILGDGEERHALEKLVASSPCVNDIYLAGSLTNPYPFMAKASVFVLSSSSEGFGMVLIEALACGTTVVSTDCHSGPAEILEDGKYGRLVPVGDAQALANAIEQSLEHPFPAEQSVARAREFSVEKAVREYLKVLLPNYEIKPGIQ